MTIDSGSSVVDLSCDIGLSTVQYHMISSISTFYTRNCRKKNNARSYYRQRRRFSLANNLLAKLLVIGLYIHTRIQAAQPVIFGNQGHAYTVRAE